MTKLSCFKAYDIRGEIGIDIDEKIAYRIARATAQHFSAKSIVIGFDARETSSAFARAAAEGIIASGSNVIEIGLAGTEEMYWAVTEFGACAGIEITASHNPINYNGMKIVKSNSEPLDEEFDFKQIKRLAETQNWNKSFSCGKIFDHTLEARSAYVDRIMSFVDVDSLQKLKIVVNSGNGAAGPTFDVIADRLLRTNPNIEFVRKNHSPDHMFPNGIPNPILPENQKATGDLVKKVKANFGIAFDGDFDRCFFFDEYGKFIKGEYIVGLLASFFLEKEYKAKIVYEPRVIWNTQDIVNSNKGIGIQAKTGHAFIKHAMRSHNAIYGGEISAHHYFRDFAYCDSGMIPWLLIAELISKSQRTLSELVSPRRQAFPSLGEKNFRVDDAKSAIKRVLEAYQEEALSLDQTDGISIAFGDWRLNLRSSNTEPLMRLNMESRRGHELLEKRHREVAKLILGNC